MLEVKGDFCHDIRQILADAGRESDYIELGMEGRWQWNPLAATWLDSRSLAYTVLSLLHQLFGSYEKRREEFKPGSSEQRHTDFPLIVRDAAVYLGVCPQTVYLWVERKQILHLRVMGRNIRFLKSDLEPFRASFRQEVENGTTE